MRVRECERQSLVPEFGALCTRWEKIDESFTGQPFGVMWCVVDPGESTKPDKHPERELAIVISGRAAFLVGGTETDVDQGQVAILDASEEHVIRNRNQDEELILLSVYWQEDSSGEV